MDQRPVLSLVTPVFNEEEVVVEFFSRARPALEAGEKDYEIIFVDDGSSDGSLDRMRECLDNASGRVKIVRLARNFSHQAAITAGLRIAAGRAVVVMDSDLQDPPELIPQMLARWREGYQIIYGVRTGRKGESLFKRWTAAVFYRFIRAASHVDIPADVGDFYLLDRKVVDVLNEMGERHRFIRGLVAWVGYRKVGIPYVRDARFAGKTKYGLWKMVKFSLDATTSFSFLPLRMIAMAGAVISGFAFLGIVMIFYLRLFTDRTVIGWSSLMVTVLFIGGIQLLALGMIGEYLARIGDDVKRRPLYVIEEIIQ